MVGLSAFFLVVGHRVLIPTNITWLEQGDPAQYYLGWLFFRHADWTFPLGLNPDYGLEFGNAIAYSDSNPLLAIFFKLFSSFLPEPFQYFGLWLLACFILQAWFGWKLASLVTNNTFIKVLISGFFVFSPSMFMRLNGHFTLVGHFLILAALYLTLRKNSSHRLLPWAILLMGTAMIHAYLLAMVSLFWLVDLADRTRRKEITFSSVPREMIIIMIFTAFTCWQAGYFSVIHGLNAEGFGFYRMNLLSIIDSDAKSYIIKGIANAGKGEYEGYNFLGLGGILLLLFALCSLFSGNVDMNTEAIKKRQWLLTALILLFLFSLSNVVGIGPIELKLQIPKELQKALNIFRASGRMFWPVYYMIFFACIYIIVHSHKKRYVVVILSVILVVQITDSSAGWLNDKKRLMAEPSSVWKTPLTHPFWGDAATTYKKLKIVPPGNVRPDWQKFAYYAGSHGMATNAVYLARVDKSALEQAQKDSDNAFRSGNYDPEALYILQDNPSDMSLGNKDNLFAIIQGYTVFAPGWNNTHTGKSSTYKKSDLPVNTAGDIPILLKGEKLFFSAAGNGLMFLRKGWSQAEEWGVWSNGNYAELVLSVPASTQGFVLDANSFVDMALPKQQIEILINRNSVAKVQLKTYFNNSIDVHIPETIKKQLSSSRPLTVSFILPDAARPIDINGNKDSRNIALGLKSITIY